MDRITTAVAARGRWVGLLLELGVDPKFLHNRNMPCPFCGGEDRYHFNDHKGKGRYYCRQCGGGDGIDFVQKYFKLDFKAACAVIDAVLGNNAIISTTPTNRPLPNEIRIPKSVRDCALWLRKYHPTKLEAWLAEQEVEVRWWLATQPEGGLHGK